MDIDYLHLVNESLFDSWAYASKAGHVAVLISDQQTCIEPQYRDKLSVTE